MDIYDKTKDNTLALIIDIQTYEAETIPWPMVDKGKRPARQVDISTRHQPGSRKSKALDKVRAEYKAKNKKLRRDIYLYNYNGIQEHGLAWRHMNTSQRRGWFKRLVLSDQRIPDEALQWGKARGLI